MVGPHGQECRGINFSRFCAAVFYGRPHITFLEPFANTKNLNRTPEKNVTK